MEAPIELQFLRPTADPTPITWDLEYSHPICFLYNYIPSFVPLEYDYKTKEGWQRARECPLMKLCAASGRC